MNKTLKIISNIFLFLLITGFGAYMVHSVVSEREAVQPNATNEADELVSPYKKTNSFDVLSEIVCFDLYDDSIFVALSNSISVYNLLGKQLRDFAIEDGVRDMVVENGTVWLLYPTQIDQYSLDGEKRGGWEACSDQSDYCAITTTQEFVFVTDAANKNIVQYDKEGRLVRFIKSPQGFVIPSYAFDILSINDTLYCANSGRHQIECYTLDGVFIASFGSAGTQAGAFAGCCNPVYLASGPKGDILTSEKGLPHISSWSREGQFREVLLDSRSLGGGTAAYKVRVSGEHLYIAGKKTISIFFYEETQPK